ncbi:MAG: class I SAM-dependent methyltransferase [Acidobacteriota bacterium]|nr:class I SAM-dependent methyltransferase [Acidobacteriota bacterium]
MTITDSDRRRKCREMLEALLRERPFFHGWDKPGSLNYALSAEILHWMVSHLPEECAGLETGCGYSTLVFAGLCRRHTVISLFAHEHELVRNWAAAHNLETDQVEWLTGDSQEHLPRSAQSGVLDAILIDGNHAFPAPFMDWYWTADRLRPGGILLVDDIQLATGRVLKEFLEAERKHWRRLEVIDKTVIFQRLSAAPVARGVFWTDQPWVKNFREH